MAIETMRPEPRCGLSLSKASHQGPSTGSGRIRLPPRAARRGRGRAGRGRGGRRRWVRARPASESGRQAAPDPGARTYPFYGDHQAGIVTPAQDRLHFAAFDVTTDSRAELIGLLQDWTDGGGADDPGPGRRRGRAHLRAVRRPAGRHRRGDRAAAVGADHHLRLRAVAVPARAARTGSGWPAGSRRRCSGCRTSRPTTSTRTRSDGDLCVQACADDPQVAVHAIRNLARIAFGRAAVRWSQLGFGRTSSTSTSQTTPRNLFGFKDGTMNLKAEEPDAARRARLGAAGRRRQGAAGWPAAPTWSPGGST